MDNGAPLERAIADEVAAGMKRWATELGVTHYTHWFQPLTEGTAKSTTPLWNTTARWNDGGIFGQTPRTAGARCFQLPQRRHPKHFRGTRLQRMDPSSPVFVVDDTLCIPTVFIAYTGESLDYKTPLLKALSAVGKAAVDVCRLLQPGSEESGGLLGLGTGILLGRRRTVCRPSRPAADRAHPDGTRSQQEPAIGRPLLRSHPHPCGCLYERP